MLEFKYRQVYGWNYSIFRIRTKIKNPSREGVNLSAEARLTVSNNSDFVSLTKLGDQNPASRQVYYKHR